MKNGFYTFIRKLKSNWRVLLGLIILDILAITAVCYIQYPTYQAVIAKSLATSKELTATMGTPIAPTYENMYMTFGTLTYIGIAILWVLLIVLTCWLAFQSHWVEKKMTNWYQEKPRLAKLVAYSTIVLFVVYLLLFFKPGSAVIFVINGELVSRIIYVLFQCYQTVIFTMLLWLMAFWFFYRRLRWPKKPWVNINP